MQATNKQVVFRAAALDSLAKCAYELIVDAFSGSIYENTHADYFRRSVLGLNKSFRYAPTVKVGHEFGVQLGEAITQALRETQRRNSLTKRSARKLCKVLADLPRQAEVKDLYAEPVWNSMETLARTKW
jgi:hypothetical protein